ncbi:putative porin [Synechococcus sp. BIOS-E4-1]|uniref:iron uptake porin n=1 Tax=Synechococcus sp. BIOS-E4-1 TaxID=1400864 RepID=UPI001646BE2E|nr:iron uptake porin [Synechococcus sp. BIOS-E4-1]QNI52756.1 putative porin [Synechococcus sp. BIOS-E4-1]
MKLAHQFLACQAVVALLAQTSATNATELSIDRISSYVPLSKDAVSVEQVTSITQFSDVYPTDWAYQALSNLIERYGCVAGYPNGTYRGNRAMTRFEAAALLNACLDRVTEVTDELKRLMKEFEKELAIVKGRVDGLEARVGELEATQFSTTTKLKGKTTFVIGGVNANGDSQNGISFDQVGTGGADAYNEEFGALTFNYNLDLFLDTSFTGKDLLRTKLRAGNFGQSAFGGRGVNLTGLNIAFASEDNVKVDRLFYKFPIGESFTFIAGAKARNTEVLAMWPSVYTKGGATILDYTAVAGVPGVYNKATGQLIGGYWQQKVDKGEPNLNVSINYVTGNKAGSNSNPGEGGFMTENSAANLTAQVGWGNGNYGIAGAYRYGQCDSNFRKGTSFVQNEKYNLKCTTENGERTTRSSNSYALNAYWQPEKSGLIPSISIGWSINTVNGKRIVDGTYTNSQSWFTGLKWEDALMDGNALGIAVGQPTFATALEGSDTAFDGNYIFELYYNFQVTDNIAVAPALFYLSRPMGQNTQNLIDNGAGYDGRFNVFGGLIQTTFKF